jgi:hypothetical protein
VNALGKGNWIREGALPAALAFLVGLILWAASPALTGHTEPWDGDFGWYLAVLLAVGFCAGVAFPKSFWAAPVGVYFGQAVAMLLLIELGPLAPLGLLVALPFASLVTLIGWACGAALHHLAVLAYTRLGRPSREQT